MSLNCSSSANLGTDWINAAKIFSTSKEGKLILQLLLMDSWLIGIGNNNQVYQFIESTGIISSFYIDIFKLCLSPSLRYFPICISMETCWLVSACPVGCGFFVFSPSCEYFHSMVVSFLGCLRLWFSFFQGFFFFRFSLLLYLHPHRLILHVENCHQSQWEFRVLKGYVIN